MKEKIWVDLKNIIKKRIDDGNISMKTKSQGKKFWLRKVVDSNIRIEREDSDKKYEEIPKSDFIDIWEDLQKDKFREKGYKQKDLHEGNNWHTAASFSIMAKLPYIKWKKDGRAWKLKLVKNE